MEMVTAGLFQDKIGIRKSSICSIIERRGENV